MVPALACTSDRQKMGWRQDQGIGRKVRRNARTEEDDVAESDAHMFAPEDARVMPIPREEVRRKGLGYLSEARLGVLADKADENGSSPSLHFRSEEDGLEAGSRHRP